MSQTALFWAVIMIILGAGMYIYTDAAQVEAKSTPGAWLTSGYSKTMGDMQMAKNLGIAIAALGAVVGIAGAFDNKSEPKT
jgi:hypothetical protein